MRLTALLILLFAPGSTVDAWRHCRIRELPVDAGAHSIHSYYVSSPESPDGRWVMYYSSTLPTGYEGEVRVFERATGKSRTIAAKVTVEDAHRAACQQWVSKGKRVVYHDFRDGEWQVVRVDLDSLEARVLVKGRQVGFGAPLGDVVPVYSPHGNPGSKRDLELLNVETGELRTLLAADTVKAAYPEWIAKVFGEKPISLFFPVLSPDGTRVFFKMASASPTDLDLRSPESFRRYASERHGLFCYDVQTAKLTFPQPREWGHPAWHPDGKQIIEINHTLIDAATGAERHIPNMPRLSGGPHPSMHPDGSLFATDFSPPLEDPRKGWWSILIGAVDGSDHAVVKTFDLNGGAKSWRRNHPHPVFSPDGKRLYFNATDGPWSRVMVAELAE